MDQLGDFLIEAALGAGSFGSVYRARHRSGGAPVAIKVFDRSGLTADQARGVLRREAQALTAVRSPDCLQVLGVIDTPQALALVTDYVEGVPLSAFLAAHGPLTAVQALQVIGGAARGLAAVHAAGLVHGDIKPANILLDTAGGSRLIDFGLAGVPGPADDDEVAPYGSPAYASPEQIATGFRDARSDLYALGVTLYELICRQRPFTGDAAAVLDRKATAPVPDPRTFVPDLPADLVRVLLWPLQTDPALRPPDVATFLGYFEAAAQAGFGPDWRTRDTLATAVAGLVASGLGASGAVLLSTLGAGAQAGALTAAGSAGTTAATTAGTTAGSTTAAVASGGAGAGSSSGGLFATGTAKIIAGVAAAATVAAGATTAVLLTRPAPAAAPRLVDTVAVIRCATPTSACTLDTMDLDGSRARTLAQLPVGAGSLSWSRAADAFVYVVDDPNQIGGSGNGTLHVIRTDGSHDRTVATGNDPTWSPDGSRIAFDHCTNGCTDRSLRVVNADGTGSRVVDPVAAGAQSWSPDGRKLVYAHVREGYGGCGFIGETLYVINADGTGKHKVADDADFSAPPQWTPDSRSILIGTPSTTDFGTECGGRTAREAAALVSSATAARTQVIGAADGPVLSPDGKQIAFLKFPPTTADATEAPPAEVWVAGSDGSRPHRLAEISASWPTLRWSPDATRVLALTDDDARTLWVLDANGSGSTILTEAVSAAWLRTPSRGGHSSTAQDAVDLGSALVPPDCGLPAQRLVDGRTTHGSPGDGAIDLRPARIVRADFAGLGYDQALTTYDCNAGGVGWPSVLVLIGGNGALLGSLELGFGQEHSTVASVTVTGRTARLRWDSYEGAGFDYVYHQGTLAFHDGRLTIQGQRDTYTPEYVADAITTAAYDKSRSTLKDPHVVPDDLWQLMIGEVGQGAVFTLGATAPGSCTRDGDRATCTMDETRSDGSSATFSVVLTADPTAVYGWRVTHWE